MTCDRARGLFAAVTGLFVCATTVSAATWYVDDDGGYDYTTIQAAVNAASNGDTIIVRDGTYVREGGSQNRPVIDFSGKALTIESENGPANCILSKGDHVVRFNSGEGRDSVLDGFTITGADPGGGIGVYDSGPTIINNIVTGNWSEYGLGAVLLHNSTALVAGNVITGNRVYGQCAGIFVCHDSDAVIVSNTIVGNALDDWDNNNGAIYCTSGGTATITNLIAWNNGDYDLYGCSATYSCLEDASAGTGNSSANPQFVNLGSWDGNGDYTGWDFRLDANSPCIDAGDNTAMPSLLTKDMDGTARIINVPGVTDTGYPPGAAAIVDMGAYEVLPEPSSLALIGAAMTGLLGRRRKKG